MPKIDKSAGNVPASAKTVSDEKKAPDQLYFFHEGSDCRAYQILGAHPEKRGGKDGWMFRVWAPEAQSVGVIGDFNAWDESAHRMKKISVGVWELFIPGLGEFESYKYAVRTPYGTVNEKADPYAFHAETRPKTASKTFDISGYEWGDGEYMAGRADVYSKPVNIYELHLGSWKRGEGNRELSYLETAESLVGYVSDMGYTHIELMPVMEHPLDASWGYQVTGHFAPTSRFGTPKEFMRFVDLCHQAGIGVILDWVPAHFPKDGFGLISFDGSCCYEYSDPSRREQKDWGTLMFDYGRNEVRSFLMSSAMFWLDMYHADGLRVDAVASMLYLDYARQGSYVPNIYGGRENLEAVSFFRKLNEQIYAAFPHTLMIAEESTAWPMVTKPAYLGGLGFNFKWSMGWMNDTLHYMKLDPIYRQHSHTDLTFSMMYAFSENYILPISHDEVVHGKCSLIEKMPGYYPDKFAGVRAYLSYMIAHPGKKLTFMGTEFGQFIEWNEAQSLDWHLKEYEMHAKLSNYVRTLNRFYLAHPELWENDQDWGGFSWIVSGDYQGNTLAFSRYDRHGKEIVCVFNFSPVARNGYRVGASEPGTYRELLNSNAGEFGGWGHVNNYDMHTTPGICDGREQSFMMDLPPYSAVFLQRV
ncbi:MAG: 1,4-alpha-glucan branching protein GlgB [Oscillospiraceae bacterium]|jgi:1,4-alpha-glucan branching enzyme|nr:1,4-alpha-glucan branching protein GlgB [Oscillospiraceae bacterium]